MAIRKDKKTYTVDITIGIQRTRKKGFKTLKEAKEFEYAILNTDTVVLESRSEKLIDAFKQYLEIQTLDNKTNSVSKSLSMYKNYIKPYIQRLSFSDIDSKFAMKFKMYLDKQKISTNYKRHLYTSMSSFFNFCVKFDFLEKNPLTKLQNFKKEKVEMSIWNYSEFMKFNDVVDDPYYEAFFWLLFFTGMRKGEALALTWDDIDLKRNTIKISKSTSYVTGHGYVTGTPKTPNAYRTIYIDDLTKVKLLQIKGIDERVFYIDNTLPGKTTFTRKFLEYLTLANLPKIRIHDLRHSHVALLIHLNEKPITIMQRLGHSSISITMDVYGHLYDDDKKITMNKLHSLHEDYGNLNYK